MSVVMGFDHVSKRYQISSRRHDLRDVAGQLLRRLKPGQPGADEGEADFWAIKDVSFEAGRGRILGIIGQNGAGKTTTLKLLSRVTLPTSGRVHVDGRMAALIELGAGFHPDLTGRENIYLNGVILGLSRKEIDRKFPSIVAFAELERFIDLPVKRYSSGMYARLGFSVAAHTDPEVLLVDEVLSVGDANFQRKCHEFIHSFVTGEKTALFVSHNMYVIEQLCNELIWLEHGQVQLVGTPGKVLPAYFDYLDQRAVENGALAEVTAEHLRLEPARFTDAQGCPRDTFATDEVIVVNLPYLAKQPIRGPHFCLGIANAGSAQPLIGASMLVDGAAPTVIEGAGTLRCRFESVPLLPRVYDVWGEVWDAGRQRTLVTWQKLGSFRMTAAPERVGQPNDSGSIRHLRADAPVRVPYRWDY